VELFTDQETKMNASKPKRGLGRGLSALISNNDAMDIAPLNSNTAGASASPATVSDSYGWDDSHKSPPTQAFSGERVLIVPITSVTPNPEQPRKEFRQEDLNELSASIKTMGVLQPIIVRQASEENGAPSYQIIAGERRWRASVLAELSEIPVIVKSFDDQTVMEAALVENIQRADLNPIEEARAYQAIIDTHKLSQQQVADRVGKERASVANALRLLKLPDDIISLIHDGLLSRGHAKAILTVKEPSAQRSLARKVLDEKLSVRALEEIVSRIVVLDVKKKPVKNQTVIDKEPPFGHIVERLRGTLGTKVAIQHSEKTGRGKIELHYFSEAELERLIEFMTKID
jgi:ParB family transcriptional regulator, chromosome partitioning protein